MSLTSASAGRKGHGTTAEHALDELRRAIVSGQYRPGQQVRQERIAADLGVSLAPVREALRALEQEGQVVYRPRRGYFLTELRVADLREIYELRALLETRAARHTVPLLDAGALDHVAQAANECAMAAERGDVAAELEANRRFHFGLLESPDMVHTTRVIRLLWDSTEAYRAMYYNSPVERSRTVADHETILELARGHAVEEVIVALDEHRDRALQVLTRIIDDRHGVDGP